ncbi:MAG: hypothetical protein AB9861_12150 [Methanosarcina sp.]
MEKRSPNLNPKTELKNGIQKRSPYLHVKCRKAASSGEAMHLQQAEIACTGQISLGCTSTDTLTRFHIKPQVYLKATSKR